MSIAKWPTRAEGQLKDINREPQESGHKQKEGSLQGKKQNFIDFPYIFVGAGCSVDEERFSTRGYGGKQHLGTSEDSGCMHSDFSVVALGSEILMKLKKSSLAQVG